MNEEYLDHENSWKHGRFVDAIVQAATRHPIPELRLPKTIDLEGKIGARLDSLIEQTLADPAQRERGFAARVNLDGQLAISKHIDIGTASNVNLTHRLSWKIKNAMGSTYTQTEALAFKAHTHGGQESSPTPADLFELLIDDEMKRAQAWFIVTPNIRFLIIRTLQTPEINETELEELIATLNQEYNDFVIEAKNQTILPDVFVRMITQKIFKIVTRTCRQNHLAIFTATKKNLFSRITS